MSKPSTENNEVSHVFASIFFSLFKKIIFVLLFSLSIFFLSLSHSVLIIPGFMHISYFSFLSCSLVFVYTLVYSQ